VAAYQAYLKGRYHWQRTADSGAGPALMFFTEAATRDPSYAAAHAGVAIVQILRASHYHEVPRRALEKAHDAARRALALDPSLAECHLAIGDVQRLLLWDARAARASYAKAIALNPSSETARASHARLLATLGRFAQAVREADAARELDPRCLTMNTVAAWTRFVTGDYDSAADLCRLSLEMDDGYLDARRLLSAALLGAGRTKEALRSLEVAATQSLRNPVTLAWLVHVRAAIGDRTTAAEEMSALLDLAREVYVSRCQLALAHAALDDLDGAFAALDEACEDRDPAVANVTIDPRFASLRHDRRYPAFVSRIRLAEFHRGTDRVPQ
jgi:serine/threonine-protein kinase